MERLLREPQDPASPDSHVACRFPWRARLLGGGAGVACPRLEKWREAFRAESVELVFATAFLNSPSSMYGHTLLKFRRGGGAGQELLHYTLSFGADTGSSGGLAYVWKGLTGAFPGFFSSAPFYLKVKEYNHVENRDFWIYPLRLSREETRALVDHAWELREARFDYFFLSKNCSWYLLDFLEAVRPDLSLTARFPAWAIPSDTVRVLEEAGLIGERERRPSRAFWVENRRALLDEEERKLAEAWAKGENPSLAGLSEERRMDVLDAAWDFSRFREGRGLSRPGGDAGILAERAKIHRPPRVFPTEATPPERAHRSARLGLRSGMAGERTQERISGWPRGKTFFQIDYRGSLHDLTDDPEGYEPHSELVMGDLRLRVGEGGVGLDRADVLRILSIAPQDSWMPRVAWNFTLGARAARWMDCGRCLEYRLDAGVGQALSLVRDRVKVFAFANAALRAGPAFRGGNFQADFGPRGGVLWMPHG
ncbi:MAG: DUF4105 domain-containing protein, partial [Bdellovibrionales bacterium]|nr:DUF4105 domain-containing protein [Bdellovibrionales bacterium]